MSVLSTHLRKKLIPWSENKASPKCIVARHGMNQSSLPPGTQLTLISVSGERVVVKNQRQYANSRLMTAIWPHDALNEVQRPKLACVLAGNANYQLGEFVVNCGPGHFIFIPPEFPHSSGTRNCATNEEPRYCELLFINMYPNSIHVWIDRYERDAGDGPENIIHLGNSLFLNGHLARLFQLMMEEVIAYSAPVQEEETQTVADGLIQAFFCALQRDVAKEEYLSVNYTDNNYQQHGSLENTDFVSEMRNYVQTRLHEVLTVENAARYMYLSRSQFTRRMRQETGQTFVEYVTAFRIQEAQRLLIESQWTASAIAQMLGFKTAKYFHKTFRQHTGMTPIAFRNLQSRE